VLHAALRGSRRHDVVVVGAGLTGLSTALELAEKGMDVAVVEAKSIGWGASGRNGGQVVTGFNKSLHEIRKYVGTVGC
jgi:gamma-glutamylputrescine oxidase